MQSQRDKQVAGQTMGYQPLLTVVNVEDHFEPENSGGISMAGMLMNQKIVKPGHRKFKKDAEGYSEP